MRNILHMYIYSNYIFLYLVDFVSLLNWSPDLPLFGILIYLQPFDKHTIREVTITADIQMDIHVQTKKVREWRWIQKGQEDGEQTKITTYSWSTTFIRNLRSFSSIALHIPYCAQFHTWLVRALSKMVAFSLQLDPTIEVNRHFFENERGDL